MKYEVTLYVGVAAYNDKLSLCKEEVSSRNLKKYQHVMIKFHIMKNYQYIIKKYQHIKLNVKVSACKVKVSECNVGVSSY